VLAATQEAAGTVADITNASSPRDAIFITITSSNGTEKRYKVVPSCAPGLNEADIRKFWENKLSYLLENNPDALPHIQEERSMFVDEEGITVQRTGYDACIVKALVIQPSCRAYAEGNAPNLHAALQTETPLVKITPLDYNRDAPPTIEHPPGENSCYLAVAIQTIANDPVLRAELPRAIEQLQANDPKRRALGKLQELINMKGHIPIDQVRALRAAVAAINQELPNDIAQKDADELLVLLTDLILDNSSQRLTTVRTLTLDDGSQQPLRPDDKTKLDIELNPNGGRTSVRERLQSHFTQFTQDEHFRTESGARPAGERTVFLKHPKRLDISFKRKQFNSRSQTPVHVETQLTLPGSCYADEREESFLLSSVILHRGDANGGHFVTLIAKPGPQGRRTYYLCDDMQSQNTVMDEQQCAAYLARPDVQSQVYKVVYISEKAQPKQTPAEAASPAAPGQQSPATSPSSADGTVVVTQKGTPWGQALGTEHLKVGAEVIRDLNQYHPAGYGVVRFTDPQFTQWQLTAEKVKQLRKSVQSRTTIDGQFIYVDPKQNEQTITQAVFDALMRADKEFEHIAIPYIPFPGLGPQAPLRCIEKAIADFKKKRKADGMLKTIKVVIPQNHLPTLLLEKETPAITAPPQTQPEPAQYIMAPTQLRPELDTIGAATARAAKGLDQLLGTNVHSRAHYKTFSCSIVPAKEAPTQTMLGDQWKIVPMETDWLVYTDQVAPLTSAQRQAFNSAIHQAVKAEKTQVCIVLHRANSPINNVETGKRLRELVAQLKNQSPITGPLFSYKDGLITEIRVVVLPPEQQTPASAAAT
jgi:hypothetical protein